MSLALPRLRHWLQPRPSKYIPWQMMTQMGPKNPGLEDPASDPYATPSSTCKDSLLSVIDQQIIPRLLKSIPLAEKNQTGVTPGSSPFHEQDVQIFAMSCLSQDPDISHAHLTRLMRQGYNTDQLFLDVIAPAARHLGIQWEQDLLDFSQVTLGLLRLHQLSHELGYAYRDGPQQAGARRRIMLASAPGSQHLLGLTIVSEFFRKERWQVVVEISATSSELGQALANEWFDVLGLSVGLAEQLEGLPSLIQTLRQQSRNPQVRVLLGGPAFTLPSTRVVDLGADGISVDAAEAVVLAAQLLNEDAT